jgi:hypothetical protein
MHVVGWGPHRAAIIGFIGGLPFAAGAALTTYALFGAHVDPIFTVVDAGPTAPLGSFVGVLLASVIVARHLAPEWASSVRCGVAFAILGHLLSALCIALLNVLTRGVGPDPVRVFVNATLSAVVASALWWGFGAAIWVGLLRGWLRSEPPPQLAGDATVRGLRRVAGKELTPWSRPADRRANR